jgi:hypothetical protein
MRWLVSLSFLLIGLVCGAGSVLYLLQNKAAETDDITFAPKAFFDNDASINISGTMTGDSLAYPNNTFSIGCYKDQKLCWITSVEQIGPKQIGRMDAPYNFAVLKWSPYEVVAGDDGGINCFKTTITISRRSKEALWVEEPINQTQPFCKNAEGRVRKRSIEDSPGWKKILGK